MNIIDKLELRLFSGSSPFLHANHDVALPTPEQVVVRLVMSRSHVIYLLSGQ